MVIGVVVASFASGFGQFGVVSALGNVAQTFGHLTHGPTLTDQAGLSGTTLGVGLAIIRLASLGALPLTAVADRFGRKRMLIATLGVGLALTVLSAASPGYWWFVAIFACGRPLLSSTGALSEVIAAEQTKTKGRASALALVAAGYGGGAGLIAIIHGLASNALGFRGLFLLAVLPLALLPLVNRWVSEPDRFTIVEVEQERPTPLLGVIAIRFRGRLSVLVVIAFSMSFITGPANSFIFLYAQNIRHLSGAITALMVVGAGLTGLVGLLLGRWMADHWGRRVTGAIGMLGLGLSGTLAYLGPRDELVLGYVIGLMFGSLFAPAGGALINELFPTDVRASALGWYVAAGVLGAVGGLVVFGAVASAGDHFARAAEFTFLPASLFAALFWCLPETRGRELEELWPESSSSL